MASNKLFALLIILLFTSAYQLYSRDWLSEEENYWLKKQSGGTINIGFDPQAGMEYFYHRDREYGFILELAELLSDSLDLNVNADRDKNWGEAFNGLQTGEIDILFGANETEERKKTMLFTEPLYRIPYSLISRNNSGVYVVGDLEKRKVGFINGDIIISQFPRFYTKIFYNKVIFEGQHEALQALEAKEIDAFITSGGIVIYDYLKDYPSLKEIKVLDDFTSDMTLSVRKDKEILASILNKFIVEKKDLLEEAYETVKYQYNYKVLDLSDRELEWITEKGTAIVGVARDYLPFELMENGTFLGINAAILREISLLTGIDFTPVQNDFTRLLEEAEKGNIQILNLAKTPDRLEKFHFTRPFSKERDIIYGHRDSPAVEDIYGLRNKKVSIVKGFWHEELLKKNAIDVELLIVDTLKDSMKALLTGKADYMIENPSVMKYFIQEWEMYDIAEKGLTSYNSFLYFGISPGNPELASIMDKAMSAIDLEKAVHDGYNEIPHSSTKNRILFQMILIAILIIGLFLLTIFTYRQARALIHSRMTAERLKEREELMYRDPMTQLYNRHYLYHKVEPEIQKWKYPQTVIICDLNNLKTTNDKWGHSVGDSLLRTFGEVLKESFERDDITIRMGGDEFMVILTGKSEEAARNAAVRMGDAFNKRPVPAAGGESVIPSAAWGIATRYHNSDISFENLQIAADNRMYAHKKSIKDFPE